MGLGNRPLLLLPPAQKCPLPTLPLGSDVPNEWGSLYAARLGGGEPGNLWAVLANSWVPIFLFLLLACQSPTTNHFPQHPFQFFPSFPPIFLIVLCGRSIVVVGVFFSSFFAKSYLRIWLRTAIHVCVCYAWNRGE